MRSKITFKTLYIEPAVDIKCLQQCERALAKSVGSSPVKVYTENRNPQISNSTRNYERKIASLTGRLPVIESNKSSNTESVLSF